MTQYAKSPSSSPIVTTSDILVASTSGWSPQRITQRTLMNLPHEVDPSSCLMSPSDSGSPSRASRTFDPNTLRSGAYVSNSPFKKPGESYDSARHSPHVTKAMGVGLGIGVGSDARTSRTPLTPTRSSGAEKLLRSPELGESISGTPRALHSSAQAPRKSKGFEVLTKSSYVSSSPFKQPSGPQSPDAGQDFKTRPLSISSSPKRIQREFASSPPATPSRSSNILDSHIELTPRGVNRAPSAVASPNTRCLLGSNNTYGTRQISSPRARSDESPTTKRKAVTFDEALDVQEFERESSFGGGSLKSAESSGSLPECIQASGGEAKEADFWIGGKQASADHRLHVVGDNAGLSSSPEISDQPTDEEDGYSLASNDSREVSTSEASEVPDPHSPDFQLPFSSPMEDFSLAFEKSDLPSSTPGDTSIATLGGFNRVDSLVDELLQTDLLMKPDQRNSETCLSSPAVQLTSPSTQQGTSAAQSLAARLSAACTATSSPPSPNKSFAQWTEAEELHSVEGQSAKPDAAENPYEVPKKRLAGGLGQVEGAFDRPLPPPPSEIDRWESQGGYTSAKTLNVALPTLPSWSPILLDSQRMSGSEPVASSPVALSSAITEPPRSRAGIRPHISRDVVLERVAKEKRAQAEAAVAADTSMPSSTSHSQLELSLRGRPSAPAGNLRPAQSMTLPAVPQRPTVGPAPHPEASSFEVRKEPRPTPLEEAVIGQNYSPLEKLGETLAQQAEQTKHEVIAGQSCSTLAPSTSAAPEPISPTVGYDRTKASITPTSVAQAVAGAEEPAIADADSSASTELILRQRRSKLALRKRSVSTGDARSSFTLEAGPSRHMSEDHGTALPAANAGMTGTRRASIEAGLKLDKLNLGPSNQKGLEVGFGNGLCRDISRIFREGDSPYNVKDQGSFSAAVDDKVTHSRQAGDVDSGKAWRRLRRPSDINEYAEEMRAYRANENPKKATGKIFVSVDSFRPSNLGVPYVATTRFFCILDNGLHVVKTGMSTLKPGLGSVSTINQEFELIQHKNLEFSLTLFVQRDNHLIQSAKARQMSPAPTPPASPSKKDKSSFMSRLLRSPKKNTPRAEGSEKAAEPSLVNFINQEGALGKVNIVFEKVAAKCLGKAVTLELPVMGVLDPPTTMSRNSVNSAHSGREFSRNVNSSRGMLKVTLFYLPPMPSVPKQMLPQNMQECIKGMQYAKWHHGGERLSGTLTQQGGDCSTWRRRPVKAQSSYLVCYNEVTKRPTVKIDLSKAVKIEESWDPYSSESHKKGDDGPDVKVRSGAVVSRYNINEEPDDSYHVARSFRVTFADGERISFFADTDEEKNQWIEAMAEMIHTPRPPNPMWAQVAFETIKTAQETSYTTKAASSSSGAGGVTSKSHRPIGGVVVAQRPVTTPATVQEETASATNTPTKMSLSKPVPMHPFAKVGTGSKSPSTPLSSRGGPTSHPLSHSMSQSQHQKQDQQSPISPTKPSSTLPLASARRAPPVSDSATKAAALASEASGHSNKSHSNSTPSSSSSGSSSSSSSSSRKTGSTRVAPPQPTVPPRRASVSFTPTRKISGTPFKK